MILSLSAPFAPLLGSKLGIDRDELEQPNVSGWYCTASLRSLLPGLGSSAFCVWSVISHSLRVVSRTNRIAQ
jgi:hypothetical protein